MADLKSGYKMVYEKDPITTTADHRDIRATKTIPAITDGQVELRDYETGTVIARNTFYKIYERIVDNAIRLYGVKRSDESVVEFTVHSSAGDLLMGTLKPTPPGPSADIYKHTIVMIANEESPAQQFTVVLYSTTDAQLKAGPIDQTEIVEKVLDNLIRYDSISYEAEEIEFGPYPGGFHLVFNEETPISTFAVIDAPESPNNFGIESIVSDTVEAVQ